MTKVLVAPTSQWQDFSFAAPQIAQVYPTNYAGIWGWGDQPMGDGAIEVGAGRLAEIDTTTTGGIKAYSFRGDGVGTLVVFG